MTQKVVWNVLLLRSIKSHPKSPIAAAHIANAINKISDEMPALYCCCASSLFVNGKPNIGNFHFISKGIAATRTLASTHTANLLTTFRADPSLANVFLSHSNIWKGFRSDYNSLSCIYSIYSSLYSSPSSLPLSVRFSCTRFSILLFGVCITAEPNATNRSQASAPSAGGSLSMPLVSVFPVSGLPFAGLFGFCSSDRSGMCHLILHD